MQNIRKSFLNGPRKGGASGGGEGDSLILYCKMHFPKKSLMAVSSTSISCEKIGFDKAYFFPEMYGTNSDKPKHEQFEKKCERAFGWAGQT